MILLACNSSWCACPWATITIVSAWFISLLSRTPLHLEAQATPAGISLLSILHIFATASEIGSWGRQHHGISQYSNLSPVVGSTNSGMSFNNFEISHQYAPGSVASLVICSATKLCCERWHRIAWHAQVVVFAPQAVGSGIARVDYLLAGITAVGGEEGKSRHDEKL